MCVRYELLVTLAISVLTMGNMADVQISNVQTDAIKQNRTPPFWIRPERMTRTLFSKPLNSLVKLRCQAGGAPLPSIEWFKDGRALDEKSDSNYRTKSFTLRILQLRPRDAGQYTCVLSNALGSIEHSMVLEVQPYLRHKPVLIDQSENVTVLMGMHATLFCTFQSDLAHVVHWLRPSDRSAVESSIDKSDPSSFEPIMDETTGSSYLGSSLSLQNVSMEDNGLYFCVAQTSGPDMTVGLVQLTVLRSEEGVLQRPENVTVSEGEDAVFTCQVHVALHEHIVWLRMDKEIDAVADNRAIELQRSSEVLKLPNVSMADRGQYGCSVGQQLLHVAHLEVLKREWMSSEEEPVVITSTLLPKTSFWLTMALVVSLFSLFLTVFSALIYRRWRRERVKKEQALQQARHISQWTKKIIIERGNEEMREHGDKDEMALISKPVVRIERQQRLIRVANSSAAVNSGSTSRSRLGSEHTTLTTVSEYELPSDPRWEFPRSQLKLGVALGEGAFGRVLKAEAKDIYGDNGNAVVAVKMLKENHSDQEMIDLVSEMDMMKLIDGNDPRSKHVVKMLGACTQEGPLMVVMEFAEFGNLRDFLRARNSNNNNNGEKKDNDGYETPMTAFNIDLHQLLSFARQVSLGMSYLSSQRCLHRDLAARNVLVMSDLVAKIADFGLARDLSSAKDDYYRKMGDGRLPVKWMAPESFFERRYTTQSDVWSFGILLWETITFGSNPYPETMATDRLFQIERLFHKLREGYRMPRPPHCPIEVYRLMLHCWHVMPVQRPSFESIANTLATLMSTFKGYLEVGQHCCQNNVYVNTEQEEHKCQLANHLYSNECQDLGQMPCGQANELVAHHVTGRDYFDRAHEDHFQSSAF